jgi:hypothetical protein
MQMTAAKTPRVTSKNLMNENMNLGLLPNIACPAGEAARLSLDFILRRVWAAASHACGPPAEIAWQYPGGATDRGNRKALSAM